MNGKMMMTGKVKKALFVGLGIYTGQGCHLVWKGLGRKKSLLEGIFNERFRRPPFAAYADVQIFRYELHKRLIHMYFFVGYDDAAVELLLWKV